MYRALRGDLMRNGERAGWRCWARPARSAGARSTCCAASATTSASSPSPRAGIAGEFERAGGGVAARPSPGCAVPGSGDPWPSGPEVLVEAATQPGRGHRGQRGGRRRRARRDARGAPGGEAGRAGQQGNAWSWPATWWCRRRAPAAARSSRWTRSTARCSSASPDGMRGLGRLILTCSGGPFRDWPAERVRQATVEEALRHPDLADGTEDHGGQRHARQQGAGGDRGALPLPALRTTRSRWWSTRRASSTPSWSSATAASSRSWASPRWSCRFCTR